MPELDNKRHEAVIKDLVVNPDQTHVECYRKHYPNANGSAHDSVYELLRKPENRERMLELARSLGVTEDKCLSRLNDHIENKQDDHLSLKAVQTGLKIHGMTDTQVNIDNSQHLHVNMEDVDSMNEIQQLRILRGIL